MQKKIATPDDVRNFIDALNEGSMKHHQFYNSNFSPQEYSFYEYLNNFGKLDSEYWNKKVLNKTYYDIETKYDPKKAPDPINTPFEITSIALYNNIHNLSKIYFLKDSKHDGNLEKNINKKVNEIYLKMGNQNQTYLVDDLTIEIEVFNNESDLIKTYFEDVLDLGTMFLIGFNSMIFDDPYTINRLSSLIGKEKTDQVVSLFTLKRYGQYNFEQPEYIRVDLLKFYKPVDQGGMGMGQSLPNYKLDTIAEVELEINKLELSGNFNEVYYNNPYEFVAYNLFDVILTFKLDNKLQFLEQLYSLAKYNNSSVRETMKGRSFIFTYRNNFHYAYETNTLLRHFVFNKEIFNNI